MLDASRRRVNVYILLLSLLVWPGLIVLRMQVPRPEGLAVLLGLLLIVSRIAPVRFHRAAEVHGITFDEAIVVAMLFVAPAANIAILVAFAVGVVHVLQRHGLAKSAFNAAQAGLGALLAGAAFLMVDEGAGVFEWTSLAAAALATLVYNVVTFMTLAQLFRLMRGQRWRSTLEEVWRVSLAMWGANTVLGLLVAFVATADTRGVLLAMAMLIAMQIGYRGFAGAVEEGRQAKRLAEAAHSLVGVASGDSVAAFLKETTRFFQASAATLVLVEEGSARHIGWVDGAATDGPIDLPESHPAREALRRGAAVRISGDHRHRGSLALAAPVEAGGRTLGALVIEERLGLEPWSEADVTLLANLASELGVALRSLELFLAVEDERGRLEIESQKLADVIGTASDGILVVDPGGRVSVWNRGMETITGLSADEAIGLPWMLVLRLRDEDGAELVDATDNVIAEVLRGTATQQVELRALRRDGTWRWLRCSLNPIRSRHDGAIAGAVVVARDATAEHEVDQMKADFIATVSHELRTPMTPLLGFVETMRRFGSRMTDDQRERVLGSMGAQLQRISRLIDDLLAAGQATDAGGSRVGLEAIVLLDVIETVVADLDPADRARVEVVAGAEVVALGKPVVAQQVLRELIDNGLKHTVSDIHVMATKQDGMAAIRVSDDGPGIGVWAQEQVFERFGRLGDHLHRTQGPGLGLPIARSRARGLGGDVLLDSVVGRGSTFALVLPLGPGASLEAHPAAAAEQIPEAG